MKLIDILNKISYGELRYGTKFMHNGNVFAYKDGLLLNTENTNSFSIYGLGALNEEVELIEPIDNNTEKIEELDNYEWEEGDYDYQIEILYRKLNEVIRYINKEE